MGGGKNAGNFRDLGDFSSVGQGTPGGLGFRGLGFRVFKVFRV